MLECRGVTLAGLGIRNVTCAYAWRCAGRRSEVEKPQGFSQIPLHVHAVFFYNNYYIIVFPLHVHCIHLARGMMRMCIPSNNKTP